MELEELAGQYITIKCEQISDKNKLWNGGILARKNETSNNQWNVGYSMSE